MDFDEFCRGEFASVVALGFALTGSWATAEDLAQDAFFAAFRKWDRLCTYDQPAAWVKRAVANRSVSWRRHLGVESRALGRFRGRRGKTTEMSTDDGAVWSMVRRLSPRQAQVVALTYVDDLSLAQVAEILAISEGTAKTHLQRARAALRDAENRT